eukprot:CAMPEP_0178464180 /NCGR_PEP_ID=MMETSP0689_2-20121128/50710_1 /TAXON_ID=160604 /ORGANISM="Amphidinium massartii, Strain CS-259" /LENGTH=119 /DNA_ID=CAMNT_0020091075 /DNA_START=2810 /DNA_END=3170 /DNA_ORIENTATION=-
MCWPSHLCDEQRARVSQQAGWSFVSQTSCPQSMSDALANGQSFQRMKAHVPSRAQQTSSLVDAQDVPSQRRSGALPRRTWPSGQVMLGQLALSLQQTDASAVEQTEPLQSSSGAGDFKT